jgi:Fe2+ or Zn2+ uptake regulation protein
MTEAGMLLKHQSGNRNYATYQYVESKKRITHFHFECKKCSRVVPLGNNETNDFVAMIQKKLGFTIDPQNTNLTGTCAKCGERFICL